MKDETQNVYELGFHFVPTLAEDEVAVQFSHLKALVEKRGGEFIAEDFPKMRDLAYEITKEVKAQKKRYMKAYFGWIKFTLEADKVNDLEKEVKAFEPMLRYLLIKTVEENTMVTTPSFKESADEEGAEAPTEETAPASNDIIEESPVVESIEE